MAILTVKGWPTLYGPGVETERRTAERTCSSNEGEADKRKINKMSEKEERGKRDAPASTARPPGSPAFSKGCRAPGTALRTRRRSGNEAQQVSSLPLHPIPFASLRFATYLHPLPPRLLQPPLHLLAQHQPLHHPLQINLRHVRDLEQARSEEARLPAVDGLYAADHGLEEPGLLVEEGGGGDEGSEEGADG